MAFKDADKGLFSRLAAAKRRQRTTSELINPEELGMEEVIADERAQAQAALLDEIQDAIGLKHPIVFDVYDLCSIHHKNNLSHSLM